ncbi:hypothetical protein ABLE94_02625 [Gordonia sp. VNK1]|uniref:hypothetical protein n=1 Tax=Gordonia oleivorans TaxID=3156618 RepID=UPI0032B4AB98
MSADGTMVDLSPVGGEVDRVAAAVAATVGGPAARRAVASALTRRCAGDSFAAIGRDVAATLGVTEGVAAKRVSAWCREAAAVAGPDLAAALGAGSGRTQARRSATKSAKVISLRPRQAVYEALAAKAGRRSVNAAAEHYIEVGLGRARDSRGGNPERGNTGGKPRGGYVTTSEGGHIAGGNIATPCDHLCDHPAPVATLPPGDVDRLAALLDRLATRVETLRLEQVAEGNNFNQVVRFTNTYAELPADLTDHLSALRQQLASTGAAVEAMLGELAAWRWSA